MSLTNQIRDDVKTAMKSRDDVRRNILRVVLGDVETQESRTGKALEDEQVHKVIRKIIAGNEEALEARPDDKLVKENEVLNAYLPQLLSQDKILEALKPIEGDLKAMQGGQAIGRAIGFLKSEGLAADGKDVTAVVKGIQG